MTELAAKPTVPPKPRRTLRETLKELRGVQVTFFEVGRKPVKGAGTLGD